MEMPDNCQCYCYAIMSSLCFPCQVKVHLLHLTASPHGELVKNVKCQSPRDRFQSPESAANGRSHTPTSLTAEKNSAQTDCDKCDYYMNFINKLTSGLCEDKIMRMVCSNPCLISPNLPEPPGDKRNDMIPPSKPGLEEKPCSSKTINNMLTQNAINQQLPSKMSLGSQAKSRKAEELTSPITRSKIPDANIVAKKGSEVTEKKPTTPTNLMTTDKMLRRSFDSIAKNRSSPLSSRSPSPEIKRTTVNLIKIDHKPPKSNNAPKNDTKLAKNNFKSPPFQKGVSNSAPNKGVKNELTGQRQTASKDNSKNMSKRDGFGSTGSGKMKAKDVSKTITTAPPKSQVPAKKTQKTSEPAAVSLITCNDEVCEFHPALHHKMDGDKTEKGHEVNDMDHVNEGGKKKTVGNETVNTGANKAEGNMNGFFEAALVMEFYQPPQLGTRNTATKPATKRLHVEYEDEPSNPLMGGGIVKQFCGNPKRYSESKKPGILTANDRAEYYNQNEFSEQKGASKQRKSKERPPEQENYTIVEEHVEYLQQGHDKMKNKNKKPSKSKSSHSAGKKDTREEKLRKKSRLADSEKQVMPSRGEEHQAQVSKSADYQKTRRNNETDLDNKPLQDNGLNGRDEFEYVATERVDFGKSMQGTEEKSCYPANFSMGRDEGKSAYPIEGTLELDIAKRASERLRQSKYNEGFDVTQGPADDTRESPPTKRFRESLRETKNNYGQRDPGEFTPRERYTNERTAGLRPSVKDEENIQKPENDNVVLDNGEYISGAPHGLEHIPRHDIDTNSSRNKENPRYSSNDTARDQVENTRRIRESTSRSDVGAKPTTANKESAGFSKYKCVEEDEYRTEIEVTSHKDRFSIGEEARPVGGVVRKLKEETDGDYRRNSAGKTIDYDPEHAPTPKTQAEETPKFKPRFSEEIKNEPGIVKSLCGNISSNSDDRSSRTGSPTQKKSRSPNQRTRNASGTSGDDATRIYPQFSEYMNPDSEGYKSKSAGNLVDSQSTHDPAPIPPTKCSSERGSSNWNCGVCPDDKRVYYHTDSEGKCTSMVIGLPQDGRNSNPHIRINFNKQVKKEITCYKVDKSEQKNDYRDTGTQCESPDPLESTSPESRPATAKSSKNRVPPKTSNKPVQGSASIPFTKPPQTSGHQQMYYNRPLMRRSFQ